MEPQSIQACFYGEYVGKQHEEETQNTDFNASQIAKVAK